MDNSEPPLKKESHEDNNHHQQQETKEVATMTSKGVGCVGVVWTYGCGCRWVWVKALIRLRRGRSKNVSSVRRHSLLDFMRLQRHAFINNLPSVYCAAMLSLKNHHNTWRSVVQPDIRVLDYRKTRPPSLLLTTSPDLLTVKFMTS
ncbi:hypothetical protein SK128_009633 [Halocaridina rubra]|uniref:Uncharacterized protein n=1 Tax=Halocaridina rubra TaxID=373956 RepID=A0AAN8WKW1_HALRR